MKLISRMSLMGQLRPFRRLAGTSVWVSKADMVAPDRLFRDVPTGDIQRFRLN
jgi:hypothetical protein